MANYKNLKPGQIVNMRELAQAALDNWDLDEMRPASVQYLEWQAAHGDEEFEISEVTARSFRDEWDMLSEYAGSAA